MSDRLKVPQCTDNNLADIISWIKLGDCVVLCNKNYRMPYAKPEIEKSDMNSYRMIYVDISSFSSLGDEGEWPYYILEDGGVFCTNKEFQNKILEGKSFPHVYHMTI